MFLILFASVTSVKLGSSTSLTANLATATCPEQIRLSAEMKIVCVPMTDSASAKRTSLD